MNNNQLSRLASKGAKIFLLFLACSFLGCDLKKEETPNFSVIGNGKYQFLLLMRIANNPATLNVTYVLDGKEIKTTETIEYSDLDDQYIWHKWVKVNTNFQFTAFHPGGDLLGKYMVINLFKENEDISYYFASTRGNPDPSSATLGIIIHEDGSMEELSNHS